MPLMTGLIETKSEGANAKTIVFFFAMQHTRMLANANTLVGLASCAGSALQLASVSPTVPVNPSTHSRFG